MQITSLLLSFLFALPIAAQTINPNQIRPATAQGQVMTTNNGVSTWQTGTLNINGVTCPLGGSCTISGGGGGITPGIGYTLPAYNSAGTTISSSGLAVDSTGNNLTVPGTNKIALEVAKGPTVNVVWFGADNTGTTDSTTAINTAVSYIESLPASANRPVLYFPAGRYTVGTSNTGYTALFTMPLGATVEGDSEGSTVINSLATHADTFFFNAASGSTCLSGSACFDVLRNMTISGTGHLGNNSAVEALNVIDFFMNHVLIQNFGGIGLSLQGSTERSLIDHVDISANNRAVMLEGDTNEDYFNRTNAINTGQDLGGWCYSRKNCTNGAVISGTIYPDYTPAVQLDGANIDWENSSIKATWPMAAMRIVSGSSIRVQNTYFEAFVAGYANPAIQVLGASEIGHTTAAITTSALTIPVDDAIYQPLYLADPATLSQLSAHSYVNGFTIYPPDYLAGDSTDLSSICTGGCTNIYRGTTETVSVNAFSADGAAHLFSRGSTAYAWPAGAVIEQASASTYGNITLANNHFESNQATNSTTCNDTTLLTTWKGSPSDVCAEILPGPVPDGYQIPIPSGSTVDSTNASISLYDNSLATGNTELNGRGWIKVGGNASVSLHNPPSYATSYLANTSLTNNTTDSIMYTTWPSGKIALGSWSDSGYGIFALPAFQYFEQDNVHLNQGSGGFNAAENLVLGNKCTDEIPSDGTTQPLTRACFTPTAWIYQKWSGSAWVTVYSVSPTATIPSNNITYAINPINTSSTYTIPAGQQFVHQGGTTATITLPAQVQGQVFVVENSASGAVTFQSPSASTIYGLNASGVLTNYGTSYTTSLQGSYIFEMDGSNYQLLVQPPAAATASIRTTSTFGVSGGVLANTCSTNTVAVTGLAATMAITVSPQAQLADLTATGQYVSSTEMVINVCNATTSTTAFPTTTFNVLAQ